MPNPFDISRSIRVAFALCAFALTAAPTWCAAASDAAPAIGANDPIQRAALPSRLAQRSVLVAVAHAGARLVAVGERGHILTSDDQARTWRQSAVPVSVTLTAVCFVDERVGWAVGHSGVILQTTDAGSTWHKQLDGVLANRLILDAAQVSGDAGRLEIATRMNQEGPDKPFFDVHFSDARHGLAVGAYGLAFATDDAGAHWRPVLDLVPDADERHLYAIEETAAGIFLAGEQGVFFRKLAHQSKYEVVATAFRSSVFALLSAPDGALLAFGLGGEVHRSTDQGLHWESSTPDGKASITAGVVVAGEVVLAGEAGQLMVSKDSGRSFKVVATDKPFPAAGLAATADGRLVIAGPLGVRAVAMPSLETN